MNNQIEVKRRIAAMDFWSGNIDIETAPNQGATVTLTLPLQDSQA